MTRRYTFDDLGETKRKLAALLPQGVTATATLMRDGWAMQVTVCGRDTCRPYDFGPGLTDLSLFRVADQWKTGEWVKPLADSFVAVTGQFVDSRNELMVWFNSAKRGERIVYFTGRLAEFRAEAPKQIVSLQALADQSRTGKPLGTADRVKLMDLQAKMDLLEAVQHLNSASLLDLTQMRMTDGVGFTYYAVKR
jgi:hypothetical protein